MKRHLHKRRKLKEGERAEFIELVSREGDILTIKVKDEISTRKVCYGKWLPLTERGTFYETRMVHEQAATAAAQTDGPA